jgi:two-component system OmpR family sensor kinase
MNQPAGDSLRRRLFSSLLSVSLVWSVVVAVAAIFTVRHAVDELLDNTLQESAEILYGLIQSGHQKLAVSDGGSLPAPVHDEHLVWQVVDAGGRVVWRSHRAPAQPLQHSARSGLSSVGEDWRVFGMSLDAQGHMLYVAQVAHIRQVTKWRAAGTTAGVTLLVGALCAVWLRLQASRALKPIAQLSDAVTHYDPMHASPGRLPATLTELEPMRHAIHDLGERLSQRVASERAFAAHAAHALRTPLAGMMAQLAVAQVKSSDEALPHLQRMGTSLDRLRSVVAALLTLFRAEQAAIRPTPVRVSEVARHLPPIDGLQVDVLTDGLIVADGDLLSAALLNLLDNAHKHGATHVQITWQATAAGAPGWSLDVRDDGQGMGELARQQTQTALDGQHYEQLSGLGLMLGDLIARAHGGRLRLQTSAQGFHVQLSGLDAAGKAIGL